MILRGLRGTVALCGVAAMLAGCGGGGGGKRDNRSAYEGFGYTEPLYRGTMTMTDASGNAISGPVGVTTHQSQNFASALGLDLPPTTIRRFRLLVGNTVSHAKTDLAQDYGDSVVSRLPGGLSIEFTGANGVRASVGATKSSRRSSSLMPQV